MRFAFVSASARVRVGGALLAALVVAGVSANASGSETVPVLGGEGKLVVVGFDLRPNHRFTSDGLYVVNADGSGLRQITFSISDEEPHWSPDGNWIAFVNTRPSPNTIVVVRGDGSGRRVLGVGENYGHPLDAPSPWSPNGTRLAWGGCGGLCVLDLASSTRHAIDLGGNDDSGFSWSPSGRDLAAVDSNGRLVIVPATGGPSRVLSTMSAEQPAWSPDGASIAFNENENRSLAMIPTQGGGRASHRASPSRTGPMVAGRP